VHGLVNTEAIDDMIKEVDMNGDGTVDFEEFMRMMMSKTGHRHSRVVSASTESIASVARKVEEEKAAKQAAKGVKHEDTDGRRLEKTGSTSSIASSKSRRRASLTSFSVSGFFNNFKRNQATQ
jgi:Ca2+-binding protein (EF-Hand superfamily)